MFIPDPSLGSVHSEVLVSSANLIPTNLIPVLTLSQLFTMSQAVHVQRENTRQTWNVEILPLGLFSFLLQKYPSEKTLIVIPFCLQCCFLTRFLSYLHHIQLQASPQPELTNDEILNIPPGLLLASFHQLQQGSHGRCRKPTCWYHSGFIPYP